VFYSILLITDKSQHKLQLVDVIKSVVNTEVRHESNIPLGLIVSMVSAAQMDAGYYGGKSRKSRVPNFFIGFTSRSVYLKEMTGLSLFRSYLLTPEMG
jgi:hypothetical protein